MKTCFPSILLSLFLIACGGGGSSGGVSPANDTRSFDGTYQVTAVSTTPLDNDGGACGGGNGSMTISGSIVSGSVLGSTTGQFLDLSGSIDSTGALQAGIAVNQQEVVTYEGRMLGDTGSGTWMDFYGCLGTWEAQRDET